MSMVKDWTQQIESHGIAHVLAKRKELMAALKATVQEATATNEEGAAAVRAGDEASRAAKKALTECRFHDC